MRDLLKLVAAHAIDDPIGALCFFGFIVIGSAFVVRTAIVILSGAAA